jgi:hypothetical protein
MHQPGKLVELKDRRDVVRALRWPWECIAAEDAEFRDALAYWQSLSPDGLVPRPADIDPVKLKRLLGWIHKVDTSDADPSNYFFRLFGSNVSLEQFDSFKGLRVSDYPSTPYRDAAMQDYHDVVVSGVPTYQQVLARVNYREYAYGRLLLPLAADRRRVTQLLVFIHERPAYTLSEKVTAGTWVTSPERDAPEAPLAPSGDRANAFKLILGGKTN